MMRHAQAASLAPRSRLKFLSESGIKKCTHCAFVVARRSNHIHLKHICKGKGSLRNVVFVLHVTVVFGAIDLLMRVRRFTAGGAACTCRGKSLEELRSLLADSSHRRSYLHDATLHKGDNAFPPSPFHKYFLQVAFYK